MSPNKISKRVVADRLAWINKMVGEIRTLPLENHDAFAADRRNLWAAESCLRRALEALMDLGRHIGAKAFGKGITEYKEIADLLMNKGILNHDDHVTFRNLAGYRNRMVHFYHEISDRELFDICSTELSDILKMAENIKKWSNKQAEFFDETL